MAKIALMQVGSIPRKLQRKMERKPERGMKRPVVPSPSETKNCCQRQYAYPEALPTMIPPNN